MGDGIWDMQGGEMGRSLELQVMLSEKWKDPLIFTALLRFGGPPARYPFEFARPP